MSNDLLFLKNPDADNDHQHTDHGHIGIAVCQLRHVFKVHSVPPGNQCQREENRGNHSQILHVAVLPLIHLSLIDLLDLTSIVDQMDTAVQQALRPVTDGTKIFELFFCKQIIFILLV